MRTESVRTIAPFWGGKRCGVDVPLYAANCGKDLLLGNISLPTGAPIAIFIDILT